MADDLAMLRLRALAKSKADQARELDAQVDHRSMPEKAWDTTKTVADAGLKIAGTPGGVARMIIANAVSDVLPDGQQITKPEDLGRLMTGTAPTAAEYMERAGVPKMGQLSDAFPSMYSAPGTGGFLKPEVGGMLDVTGRGALALPIDIATDPVSYIGKGLSSLSKAGDTSHLEGALNAVLNPIETTARKGGTAAYKGAFKKIDQNAEKLNKPIMPSQFAEDTGFVGSGKELRDRLEEANKMHGQNVGGVLDEASRRGATVDTYNELFPRLAEKANTLKNVGTEESSKAAEQIVNRGQQFFDAKGPRPTVSEANETKTALNKYNKFGPSSDVDSVAQQARQEVATPLSVMIKESVRNTDPELYARLEEANQGYSSTSPKVQDMVGQWATLPAQTQHPLAFSKIDYGLAGAGATGNPVALALLAGKKAGDVLSSTQGRTAIGFGLSKVGKNANGMLDSTARNTWEQMNNKGDRNEK